GRPRGAGGPSKAKVRVPTGAIPASRGATRRLSRQIACNTPAVTPLSDRTIATVGSGVMAEAMIAGLLRGELVAPDQIVASHPRAERRDHLRSEYGIRVVGDNRQAIDGADVLLLGIKPQMLAKVGREIGPSLVRGQVVLSVLAGATTKALVGTLGHDQVIRAMPNTPARLGKGVT